MVIQSIKSSSQAKSINRFQHRPVRDLAWSLLSPSLFMAIPGYPIDWFQDDYIDDDLYPWLIALDSKPEPLYQHLAQQRSTRLGIYFEQLLSFYFENFSRFELLAKNLQVNSKERTLGEFDFIIHDRRDKKIKHIEAAVKFYLGHQDYRGKIKNNIPLYNWHNWVGPNQKDTLAIKMHHLTEHQLLLAKTNWGQDALEKNNISGEITSRLLIKGQFYLPSNSNISPPEYHNSDLSRYYWINSTDFLQDTNYLNKNLYYCILPRAYWLSPITKNDIEEGEIITLTAKELFERVKNDLKKNTNEWHVAELKLSNTKFETRRFFIINGQNLLFGK